MSKYINADTVIQELRETIEKYKDSESFTRTVRAAENMILIIERMPSADVVEVKHGEWEGTVCSNCGASVSNYYDCDFCPKCGANMQDNPHWINHTEYGVTTYVTDKDVECSECGHRQPKLFDMNFCPNCGADMKGNKSE